MCLEPLTEFNYHHTLAQATGVCLVIFSSPACGACRITAQRLPHAANTCADRLFIVDVQQATALARLFDIFHLPALFLYRDGRFHARLDTEVTSDTLQHAIQQALKQPPQEEP